MISCALWILRQHIVRIPAHIVAHSAEVGTCQLRCALVRSRCLTCVNNRRCLLLDPEPGRDGVKKSYER